VQIKQPAVTPLPGQSPTGESTPIAQQSPVQKTPGAETEPDLHAAEEDGEKGAKFLAQDTSVKRAAVDASGQNQEVTAAKGKSFDDVPVRSSGSLRSSYDDEDSDSSSDSGSGVEPTYTGHTPPDFDKSKDQIVSDATTYWNAEFDEANHEVADIDTLSSVDGLWSEIKLTQASIESLTELLAELREEAQKETDYLRDCKDYLATLKEKYDEKRKEYEDMCAAAAGCAAGSAAYGIGAPAAIGLGVKAGMLKSELDKLSDEIKKYEDDIIPATQEKIGYLNKKIEECEAEIKDKREKIKELDKKLRETAEENDEELPEDYVGFGGLPGGNYNSGSFNGGPPPPPPVS
jgi:predicted  nucleic acid-binding Zn-ribbon protein